MSVQDGISIRRAHAADAEVLTAIAHAAKRFWGYPDELMRLWAADLTVTADYVEAHEVHCAVAEVVVGFYAVAPEERDAPARAAGDLPLGPTFELEHMWVQPERMREGIGAALFRHALAVVHARGGARLIIASDPNAAAFYVRMGARLVGTVASVPPPRTLPLLSIDALVA